MSSNYGSHRARQEQIRQRQQYYVDMKRRIENRRQSSQYNGYGRYFLGLDFHIWRVRRLAPFAMIIHAMTVLCLLGWLIFSGSSKVDSTRIVMENGKIGSFEAPEAGAIYQFDLKQIFPAAAITMYSELEIEIVDEKMNHVYSFYKDLWQEEHPNGNGGRSIYKDLRMQFEVELPKAGLYYLRAIPYNDNEGYISVVVSKRRFGNLYFFYFMIGFGVLSLLLLVGNGAWGTPGEMIAELKKGRSLKGNKEFKLALIAAVLIVVGTIIINLTHYGYAKAGEKTHLPTFFYPKNEVTYLG